MECAERAGFYGLQFNAVVETHAVDLRLWRPLGFEVTGTLPVVLRRPERDHLGLSLIPRGIVGRLPVEHGPGDDQLPGSIAVGCIRRAADGRKK